MKSTQIDAVLIGADRVTSNGDTANKIGSYQLALAAKYHNIPFFVVAPRSSVGRPGSLQIQGWLQIQGLLVIQGLLIATGLVI